PTPTAPEPDEAAEATIEVEEEGSKLFSDLDGHWAAANINKLVVKGVITGYPDGQFKPENHITRAEFATVVIKAYQLQTPSGKVFNDTANHWARDYIATAAGAGLVNGYNATEFGPDDLITREQMAVMIVKVKQLKGTAFRITFTDAADIAAWAQESVATAIENNLITGYPDNTFRPKGQATRAEAVTLVVKSF
ncbi:MAG: S-layer homology domain-containing protein, partial [Syntrophomonadaceae bacterium]|nr:S-layer homology domain-containing protein [Syntrophomonadaceae bacterium]